jgi:hypothetical protein
MEGAIEAIWVAGLEVEELLGSMSNQLRSLNKDVLLGSFPFWLGNQLIKSFI